MKTQSITPIGAKGFLAYRIAPKIVGWPTDPFLFAEAYQLSGAVFPPRPMAGYVCVHHVFSESTGGLHLRNSLGQAHRLMPGESLISVCGRGMVIAERLLSDAPCQGFKFALNLSRKAELQLPSAMKISAPSAIAPQGLRLIWGCYGDRLVGSEPNSPCALLSLKLEAEETWNWIPPLMHNGIAFLKKGRLQGMTENQVFRVHQSPVSIVAEEASELLLLMGAPLQEPCESFGPFAMSDALRNRLAAMQFRRGEFGEMPSIESE